MQNQGISEEATNAQIDEAERTRVTVGKNDGGRFYFHRMAFVAEHGRNSQENISHISGSMIC